MPPPRYILFEQQALQSALMRVLDDAGVAYRLDGKGAVTFSEANAPAIMDAAHRIRDAQFPWYLLKWQTEPKAERYRALMVAAGLPYVVERHESGTWFLVRRADRAQHDLLWERVDDDSGNVSDADT